MRNKITNDLSVDFTFTITMFAEIKLGQIEPKCQNLVAIYSFFQYSHAPRW